MRRRHAGRPGRKKRLALCVTSITRDGRIRNGCGRRHAGGCKDKEIGMCSCGARFFTHEQLTEHDCGGAA